MHWNHPGLSIKFPSTSNCVWKRCSLALTLELPIPFLQERNFLNCCIINSDFIRETLRWSLADGKERNVEALTTTVNHVEAEKEIARPLSDLTKKNKTWTWGEPERKAFESLKKNADFTTCAVTPDGSKTLPSYLNQCK
ncbi:hypothetical protein AVEN_24365-1 [Araneus ventricosus]|uniref:Reverse transcriptase/retrotransposon-derived protein RNase H-like domain-containing protein n=1 Tax=Araneus ventricosus TaxID=182803 RepID=A0A4Y2HU78_ARAVE|nr:hypothetical protein AVEN_24365-1 [Araneus ventricosus]